LIISAVCVSFSFVTRWPGATLQTCTGLRSVKILVNETNLIISAVCFSSSFVTRWPGATLQTCTGLPLVKFLVTLNQLDHLQGLILNELRAPLAGRHLANLHRLKQLVKLHHLLFFAPR
jgi:hypothetical protein